MRARGDGRTGRVRAWLAGGEAILVLVLERERERNKDREAKSGWRRREGWPGPGPGLGPPLLSWQALVWR